MNENINSIIGKQLKTARATNGWSLDATYQKTGVSKAMLGQIERGESSPTIAKLWKIANGFELPISFFLSPIDNHDDLNNEFKSDQGISVTTIFPFDPITHIEVLSLTLTPTYQHTSDAHNAGTIEHIVVLKGEMEYLLDGKWLPLQQNQVVKFRADKIHGYRNVSNHEVIFQNIIFYRKN
tara:strand:+ start:19954 stop:20496 length:543 start_codon:yes stop_codon:yes gene_type:complete